MVDTFGTTKARMHTKFSFFAVLPYLALLSALL